MLSCPANAWCKPTHLNYCHVFNSCTPCDHFRCPSHPLGKVLLPHMHCHAKEKGEESSRCVASEILCMFWTSKAQTVLTTLCYLPVTWWRAQWSLTTESRPWILCWSVSCGHDTGNFSLSFAAWHNVQQNLPSDSRGMQQKRHAPRVLRGRVKNWQ